MTRPACSELLACALLCSAACAPRATPAACSQFPNREPLGCERTADGAARLAAQSIPRVGFDDAGLGAIFIGDGLFFVNRAGRTAPAFFFDNGPDPFAEGLARTIRNGKVGFVNLALDEVIAPAWDWASPFSEGVAAVCLGCVSKPVFPGAEHTVMSGGKWGYIDRHGSAVVPVTNDEKELPPVETAAGLVRK